jgi:hypothetical protein
MYVCVYVCMCVCINKRANVHIICVYVCMYVCMYKRAHNVHMMYYVLEAPGDVPAHEYLPTYGKDMFVSCV